MSENVKHQLNCPNCGHVVAKSATQCPDCGNKLKMTATFTYVVSGLLVLLALAFTQIAPGFSVILIGGMFYMAYRLAKKRYDRKLSICYGNIISHRAYKESFIDELFSEVKEVNGLTEKQS